MDITTFETFFKENYDSAIRLALRFLHDEEAARDVVSDAFEMVWKHSGRRGVQNLPAYLSVSVRNLSMDVLRKKAVRDRYARACVIMADNTCDEDAEAHERRITDIMAAIDELTPRTRQVICACYVERKKYREAAAEMGISESAVKKHIVQALKYLREKFHNAYK